MATVDIHGDEDLFIGEKAVSFWCIFLECTFIARAVFLVEGCVVIIIFFPSRGTV